jgi:predicted nucleic acid-binding protein
MIVLDTNVLSELMRPSPNPAVEKWVAAQPAASLFVTTVTQAEILYGIAILPSGRRRDSLDTAATEMFRIDFADRVLPFDSAAAPVYAAIAAEHKLKGRPISHFDAQIAAIAKSRGSAIASRNIRDFEHTGVQVIDPWHA